MKWIEFNPDDESTWPKPFTYVITNLGVGQHRCLHYDEDAKDETWDYWSIMENNRDEATIFTGFMGDPEIEVTHWMPVPEFNGKEPNENQQ